MITYKDMTFCVNKLCRKDCNRRLTPEINKEAEENGLWLAVAVFDCEEENANIQF